jgi:hypothetical protein
VIALRQIRVVQGERFIRRAIIDMKMSARESDICVSAFLVLARSIDLSLIRAQLQATIEPLIVARMQLGSRSFAPDRARPIVPDLAQGHSRHF